MSVSGSIPTKVFISYAWSSEEHDEWVVRLATRLEENGIAVVLDKWDLTPGQDKFVFMEQMVTAPDIDKVLVICDQVYKSKSDERSGGVGTEAQILSAEVYKKVDQERVIPIIAQPSVQSVSVVPVYMQNRIFIDLSNEEKYESGYEQLLRVLYKRPLYRRPVRGIAPAYLFDEAPTHSKTANLISQIKDSIQRNPARIQSLSKEFIQVYLGTLPQFSYEASEELELDDVIVNYIHEMIPLRNDYIQFVEILCHYQEVVESTLFIEFFEKLYQFTKNTGNLDRYDERQSDHFRFFIRELFLFTVMIYLKNGHFLSLDKLLKSSFFINRSGSLLPVTYYAFNFIPKSLDETRNNRLNARKISLTADILINEHATDSYREKQIIEADLFLYYHSVLCSNVGQRRYWYPITYVYDEYIRLEIIQRLQSTAHAEKTKSLFGAVSIADLKSKFINFENVFSRQSFHAIPTLEEQLENEKIGSMP